MKNKQLAFNIGLVTWILAAIFFLYEFFLRTFVGSLAPQIIPDLHLSINSFAIMSAGYYVAYGLMQIPVGLLSDRFGLKMILVIATCLCALATLVFSGAHSFLFGLVGRLLMGLGSSFAFVCLLMAVREAFPKQQFGFFAGVSQFIGTMGPLLAGGPLLAFLFDLHMSWRKMLVLVSIAGIVLALAMLLLIRNKKPIKPLEKPSIKPHLKQLFKTPQAFAIAGYSAATYASIALLGAVWGTDYLTHRGLTQTMAGQMISSAWLGYAIGCPLVGFISDITKRRKPALVFCALIGFISTAALVYLPEQPTWCYALICFGIGIGASGQNVGFATITEQVNKRVAATAIGLNNSAIMLAATAITPIASFFISDSVKGNVHLLTAQSFTAGLSIMPALYILAMIFSVVFIKETYCAPAEYPAKSAELSA